ncbi:MAG: hypothetical protein HC882_05230 [Acidobacteria bacterium]|nr:hypothetical protein [Acidobacteriota bacterium]
MTRRDSGVRALGMCSAALVLTAILAIGAATADAPKPPEQQVEGKPAQSPEDERARRAAEERATQTTLTQSLQGEAASPCRRCAPTATVRICHWAGWETSTSR